MHTLLYPAQNPAGQMMKRNLSFLKTMMLPWQEKCTKII